MKKLFAFMAVAVLASSISMVGCKKGEKADPKVKETAAGICEKDKIGAASQGLLEFILRATYDKDKAGGKTIDDSIKLALPSVSGSTELSMTDCKFKEPYVMKCDEVYDKMSKSLKSTVDKAKEAGKQMGITDCAKITVDAKEKGQKATGEFYFGKAKDKWVWIGTNEPDLAKTYDEVWKKIKEAPMPEVAPAADAAPAEEVAPAEEEAPAEEATGTEEAAPAEGAEAGEEGAAPAEGEEAAPAEGEAAPQ